MMNDNLDDLRAFAVVARERSFTHAATRLRLSTSALSYRIKGLEDRLRVRLLQRNSRSVSVTEAWAQLLQTLEPALANIDDALDALGRATNTVSGTVRITASRYAFDTVIRPVLPGFCSNHPDATVEVPIDMLKMRILSRSSGNKGAGSPHSRRTSNPPATIPATISATPIPPLTRA